jgi:hypothetical protein
VPACPVRPGLEETGQRTRGKHVFETPSSRRRAKHTNLNLGQSSEDTRANRTPPMVPILRRERDRASTVSFACVGSQFDAVSAVSHSDESHSSQQRRPALISADAGPSKPRTCASRTSVAGANVSMVARVLSSDSQSGLLLGLVLVDL